MAPINDLRVTSLIEAILPQISTTFIDVTIPTATPGKTFLEKEAIADDALWENIRHHRELFTPIMGVDYKDDIRKHLCLVPSEKYINEWERDYQYMCESMIYGEKLSFNALIERLHLLEERFRQLSCSM